jgi:preprotein translocase subunit SecD
MSSYSTKAKSFLVLSIIIIAIIYSLPNFYGEKPAIQIKSSTPSVALHQSINNFLKDKINDYKIITANKKITIEFNNINDQTKAKDILEEKIPNITIALDLQNQTPKWLQQLRANPMRLGLDLRGGVHFLLNVDIDTAIKLQNQQNNKQINAALKKENIRLVYSHPKDNTNIQLAFADNNNMQLAQQLLNKQFSMYQITQTKQNNKLWLLTINLKQNIINEISNYTIEKTINTINNRVNELGVAEAVITRNGIQQISVDLPGVQDPARAKALLGKTATLYFHLVNLDHNPEQAMIKGAPIGTKLYYDEYNRPILLNKDTVLTGESITYASMNFSQGKPAVSIRLGGGQENEFHKITSNNIGKALAVVYVDTEMKPFVKNKQKVYLPVQHEKIISVATIQSALGQQFEITGLKSVDYADNLALLLRSGSLAAPVNIIQELTIGPSLGQDNIDKGVFSLAIGSALVILFMLVYYRIFGLVANIALILNVMLIIAILSVIEATLTLPGIAGIVLTVGMAVDANVLINERIREEIRQGLPPLSSIKAGYERAFSTILDSNLTTLLVAFILFTLGSGTVKGFAVTLTIGLAASMFTSIVFTRVLVEKIYSNNSKKLSIGI